MEETNPLVLIVKEKELGRLVTNALDIKVYVEEQLKNYAVDTYKGDAKQASKDRAEINAAIKMINDRRIELEKDWNKPFNEFKGIIKETTDMMAAAASKLDAIVKAKEEEERTEKRNQIEKLWETKKFNLASFNRIFKSKWLNKTVKMKAIDAEMDEIIKRINNDIESLAKFGEDTASLRSLYLSTLDLRITLEKGAELKANRERLAEMEARKEAEEKKIEEIEPETIARNEKKVENGKRQLPENEEKNKKLAPLCKVNILCNEVNYGIVERILKDIKVSFLPSFSVAMTAEQAELFKRELAATGIVYNKIHLLTLDV